MELLSLVRDIAVQLRLENFSLLLVQLGFQALIYKAWLSRPPHSAGTQFRVGGRSSKVFSLKVACLIGPHLEMIAIFIFLFLYVNPVSYQE